MISETAIIHDNVEIGENAIVEDFVIIGAPFKNYNNEKTVIGSNAHIRSHTVIYAGNTIGDNFQTGNKTNIRECNQIGDNVSIGTNSIVEHHVKIEDNVRIHSQAFIPEYSVLKKDSWIGPHVVLTNAQYPKSPGIKENLLGVTIGENAKIGANTTLLPGVSIGAGALIGAGSVVTKSIEGHIIAAGCPCKKIRDIFY